MGKINILDSSIFNRIAAGEVVERPMSIVKELLDNSIDAKASEIIIDIKEGGIKEITITDNGQGIEFDDLEKVFLPHATSKIKTVEDLEKIGTLGFRGEALASIGAISEVEVISKTNDCDFGGKITISGGKLGEKQEIGAKNGTTIKVSNIFFNVPARAKFLKKPRQEASEISNLVLRYILANPTIKFVYKIDDKEIYSSTGNNLFEAIYTVYGKETTNNLMEVDLISQDGIKVSGYVGNPTFTKPNRTYQTLIINGRYVVNQMISLCVYNAFEHYLMKGQFPFFVLNLNLPLEKVDVNVHPSKMEVRFENSNNIYGIVYEAIMNALEKCNKVVEVERKVFEFEKANTVGVSFADKVEITKEKPKTIELKTSSEKVESPLNKTNSNSIEYFSKFDCKKESSFCSSNDMLSKIFNQKLNENIESGKQVESTEKCEENSTMQTFNNLEKDGAIQTKIFDNKAYKFIGTLFNTYLVFEEGENAYFVDQHASHERLLFDKLKEQVDSKSLAIQSLLVPYSFTVNNIEREFLLDNVESLQSLGFEISEFGNNTYKISTIPQLLYGINIKKFIDGVLSELSVYKSLKKSDLIIEKLMQHSCKTAVKAGDILSSDEAIKLIEQIEDTNMRLQCPHGRPVVVKIDKKEIEKWFKRIV
ncbi:MAG: DNA mismatch repair endonuclease MutL [Clostridiales bacterium]|nr:DNA mismatch repair endonuclease MutL [Candidatus Apopatousia equi]